MNIDFGDIRTLLSTKRFLPLFICQFLSALGDNLIRTALVTILTYKATELNGIVRSILVTLAMGLFMLPSVILSATSGQLADKFNKATLIKWIRLLGIGVTTIGIIGFYTNNYVLILLCIFLTGTEATLFGPVKYSILPNHLERKELLIGNGLVEAGTFIAILLGIISGGILGSLNDNSLSVVALSLMGVTVASYVASLFIPDTKPASKLLSISSHIINETIESVKHIKKDRNLFLAILGISWFWMIGGVFMSQLPGFTKETLKGDHSVLILLLSIFSIGTGLGSIICGKLLKGQIDTRYIPTSSLFMTLFILLLWYTSTFFSERPNLGGIHYFLSHISGVLTCIEILMISICGGIYIVPLYAFIQVNAKESHRSRTIAANNIINAIFIVTASVITLFMLSINIRISNIILLVAIINFLTSVYICRILPDTIIKNILQWLFKLFYRVEIHGMENFYKAGERVLIIANHASFIDPPLIGAFLPKRLVFAIDTYHAQSWWIKPFLAYLNAYPIDPTNPLATKTLIDLLKQKNPVVIFPEGRITITGSLMKIYEGPGLIADKAKAKLLPIRIDGPQYSPFSRLHGKVKLRLFPKIKINILEPQSINVPDNIVGKERRHIVSKKLYDIMSNMMFEGSTEYITLFESLIEAKEQYGAKHIVIEDADRIKTSYKKMLLSSFLLGSKIAEKTNAKTYVGIFLPNSVTAAVMFFANLAYDRVPAMINYSTGIKNMITSCKAAKISIIYTSRRFIEKASLQHFVDRLLASGIEINYLEDVKTSITIFDKLWSIMASMFPRKFYKLLNNNKIPSANKPAVVLFTSGSEGIPKGVVLSHINIQANIKQAASRISFNSSDKVFNSLPMFHSFGLTGGFLLPVLSGVRTFLYPSPLHYRIIPEIIYGNNATIIFGTDTFLSGYAKHAHPYDFFSVRYIFSGAEKLKEETRKIYMDKFGLRILEGYGTTETSPIISVNTPMHYKAGTVGRIVPNITHVLDKVKGINTGGKLIVQGPNVMLGYLKPDNPGAIQPPKYKISGKLQKGWHDTGDIVSIDEDGFITIIGRANHFAKIGGETISLAIVQEVIQTLWPDNLHAAINQSDPKKGEMIILFTDYKNATKEQLLKHFKEQGYSELFVPKIIKYLKDIPVLGTGKIDYTTIKELAEDLEEKEESED